MVRRHLRSHVRSLLAALKDQADEEAERTAKPASCPACDIEISPDAVPDAFNEKAAPEAQERMRQREGADTEFPRAVFTEEMKEQGYTIVFISHKLREVMEICDRYTVLRDGVVVADGRVEDTTISQLACDMVGHAVKEVVGSSMMMRDAFIISAREISTICL